MNQKRGLIDSVSSPTMEIPGTNSGAKEKHQLNPDGPSNSQEAPASTNLNE